MTVIVKPYIRLISYVDIFQIFGYSGSAYAGDIRLVFVLLCDITEILNKNTALNLLLFAVLRRQTKIYHSQLTLRK